MKIWSVSNQKGGVGKTTSVVTLGGILAQRGHRTLLVDLDPHGSLTSYFRLNPDEIRNSVYDLFQDALAKRPPAPGRYVTPTGFDRLAIMPASTALSTMERHGGAGGMGLVLSKALRQLDGQFDFALIDSPPMLGVLMVNALAASQQLFIPVVSEFLALKGLERMVHTLDMIGRSRRVPLATTIVPTMFDRRIRASLQTLQVMRDRYGERLWRSVIPVDTKLRESSQAGVPPPLFAPGCRSVVAYSELLDDHLGMASGQERAEPPTLAAAG